jgi:hypothetical protein
MLKRLLVIPSAFGMVLCPLAATAQVLSTTTPLRYTPLQTPCRAVDTTSTPGGSVLGGTVRIFNPAGGGCSIPPPGNGVIAYAVNLTVYPQGYLGYISMWPAGYPFPPVSTLNSYDGRVKANAAIVAGGTNGEISVFATNTTDISLDVGGYFTTDPADVYVPISPCRLVDTRINAGTSLGGPSLKANQQRVFPLANNMCNLPAGVLAAGGALSLNVTVIPLTTSVADVTVWGASLPELQPSFPTVLIRTPFAGANAAIVTIDNAPSDSVAVSAVATNDVDLVLDVTGYFASPPLPTPGLSLYLLAPCRVLDTRFPPSDSLYLPLGGFLGELTVPFSSGNVCIPTSAQAYVINATVVPLPVVGVLTLWADSTSQPYTSTLNAPDGYVTSNMAIVASFNGSIDAFASNQTELILDVSGYFDPGP